jgi:VIT1/CCC1 family predicted Fe2+/Mn2+ transporter
MLKIFMLILLISLIASLFGGLNFLVKDLGGSDKKRLLYALGLRVSLAVMLVGTIIYGAYTGQIKSQAPWDKQLHPENAARAMPAAPAAPSAPKP